MLFLGFYLMSLDREVRPLYIWSFVFCFLIICTPNLIFDLSFQLSFSAVLGIFFSLEWIKKYKIIKGWQQYFIVSIAAQTFTLAFVLYYFGYMNFLSLFYNIPMTFLISASLVYSLILALSPLEIISSVLGGGLSIINQLSYTLLEWTRFDSKYFTWGGENNVLIASALSIFIIIFSFYFCRREKL